MSSPVYRLGLSLGLDLLLDHYIQRILERQPEISVLRTRSQLNTGIARTWDPGYESNILTLVVNILIV